MKPPNLGAAYKNSTLLVALKGTQATYMKYANYIEICLKANGFTGAKSRCICLINRVVNRFANFTEYFFKRTNFLRTIMIKLVKLRTNQGHFETGKLKHRKPKQR